MVSTHSRAEAAAQAFVLPTPLAPCFNTQPRGGGCGRKRNRGSGKRCFNTQPRGGGCDTRNALLLTLGKFQHTAARRRLPIKKSSLSIGTSVSTHSRAEAAAFDIHIPKITINVSTHSRAEAAAIAYLTCSAVIVGFNTQPRGGGCYQISHNILNVQTFQHTAARRRLLIDILPVGIWVMFQHTAARRRLHPRVSLPE